VTSVGVFGGRGLVSRLVSSWMVPISVTCAYAFMMLTADTDSSVDRAMRIAWMSLGLAFVLVVWWVIKLLVADAAISRAVEVGDADRLRELLAGKLGRSRDGAVYRALAHDLSGEWRAVIDALDARGDAPPKLRVLAATLRATALVELGDVAAARAALATVRARIYSDELLVRLAAARAALAAGDDGARAELARIADDVRSGARVRATARALQKRPIAATPT
jgi:hypothetical protein